MYVDFASILSVCQYLHIYFRSFNIWMREVTDYSGIRFLIQGVSDFIDKNLIENKAHIKRQFCIALWWPEMNLAINKKCFGNENMIFNVITTTVIAHLFKFRLL